MAVADFDGDGRLDLAINNNNAAPTIFRNRLAESGNWLELTLAGSGNRDAVGARVRVTLSAAGGDGDTGGGKTLTRWVEAGSGYASQSAFPLHFGLGEASRVEAVEIVWPSGHVDQLAGAGIAINRRTLIEEGGEVAEIFLPPPSGGGSQSITPTAES